MQTKVFVRIQLDAVRCQQHQKVIANCRHLITRTFALTADPCLTNKPLIGDYWPPPSGLRRPFDVARVIFGSKSERITSRRSHVLSEYLCILRRRDPTTLNQNSRLNSVSSDCPSCPPYPYIAHAGLNAEETSNIMSGNVTHHKTHI